MDLTDLIDWCIDWFIAWIATVLALEPNWTNWWIKPQINLLHWINWSGQIIIFHQPRFPWNKWIFLTKPPFGGNRSCNVAIIWPDWYWSTVLLDGCDFDLLKTPSPLLASATSALTSWHSRDWFQDQKTTRDTFRCIMWGKYSFTSVYIKNIYIYFMYTYVTKKYAYIYIFTSHMHMLWIMLIGGGGWTTQLKKHARQIGSFLKFRLKTWDIQWNHHLLYMRASYHEGNCCLKQTISIENRCLSEDFKNRTSR